MRNFASCSYVGLIAWIFAAATLNASSQEANFHCEPARTGGGDCELSHHGDADGYDSSSLVRVMMQGLNYALSKNEELSSANELKHVQLSATVNDQAVNVSAKPDAAQLLMNISANGRSSTTRFDAHHKQCFCRISILARWKRCWRWR